ncbi:MAG: hypothetical protein IH598_06655 [Bacteroidales bacterium]|nr:hypothetical protein [Bacteroidales bacterium]
MTKISFKILLGIGIILTTIAGCSKDDEDKNTTPSVTTDAVSAITHSSAIINGNVTNDGGSVITAKGLVWNTSPNPTLSNFYSVDENNITGAFDDTITGLTAQTTYYYRAYATNSEGTAYGNEANFTTLEMSSSLLYNGLEYDMDKGIIEFYGLVNTNPASYNFDVILLSPGVEYNGEDPTGQGHAILWEMFSSSSTDLVPGTYSFDANETYNANTFDYSIALIDFDMTNGSGTYVFITGGTVTIEKSGSTYTITADCNTSDNKKITGYYKGNLTFYDNSGKEKSSKFSRIKSIEVH